ncbi:hypothetical protein [Virgibacillus sp. CBA3643]|uniref:hypothetical protein n=1 Tax=Virgibacillus sp. CBA3643 TaxID=2942278 RepID=UPI0035A377C2
MADMLLEFMLGPFRAISDFYFEYQAIFNTIVLGFALYKVISSRKKTENESAR